MLPKAYLRNLNEKKLIHPYRNLWKIYVHTDRKCYEYCTNCYFQVGDTRIILKLFLESVVKSKVII